MHWLLVWNLGVLSMIKLSFIIIPVSFFDSWLFSCTGFFIGRSKLESYIAHCFNLYFRIEMLALGFQYNYFPGCFSWGKFHSVGRRFNTGFQGWTCPGPAIRNSMRAIGAARLNSGFWLSSPYERVVLPWFRFTSYRFQLTSWLHDLQMVVYLGEGPNSDSMDSFATAASRFIAASQLQTHAKRCSQNLHNLMSLWNQWFYKNAYEISSAHTTISQINS